MSKKENLKIVFDFIAEYLNENNGDNKDKIIKTSKPSVLLSENKLEKKNTDDINSVHIKDIIDRVERKATESANTTSMLKAQKNDFKEEKNIN